MGPSQVCLNKIHEFASVGPPVGEAIQVRYKMLRLVAESGGLSTITS